MRVRIKLIANGLLAVALIGVATAGPREDGLNEYNSGYFEKAMRDLRPLAEGGDVSAQLLLAKMFAAGQGVSEDHAQAAVWYLKAADQGNVVAQVELGTAYALGNGVTEDHAQALVWYHKAAEQRDVFAQFNLGYAYERGCGVPQDYAKATAWYLKAAEQGDVNAQDKLGDMYADGQEGVTKDNEQAVAWYRKAAEQGFSISQRKLGMMYQDGQGVPMDDALAETWFREAAKDPFLGRPKPVSARFCSNMRGIPLQRKDGTFLVPVLINRAITLKFTIDSGSSDVSIPADVVRTLMRTGTLRGEDFLGSRTYILADGTTVPAETFILRTLKVGDQELANVTGSVTTIEGSLLLGQSFLARFKSWSIDNEHGVLVLK